LIEFAIVILSAAKDLVRKSTRDSSLRSAVTGIRIGHVILMRRLIDTDAAKDPGWSPFGRSVQALAAKVAKVGYASA
jgi:hypothetical protein